MAEYAEAPAGERLTLMAVHAHPDDEVLGTGGVFAQAAARGIRTVLVTCTNGEQGDGEGGAKPDADGHDEAEVRAARLAELHRSAAHLGIEHVELLGYRDSGMPGWPANEHPEAFHNIPVERAAEPLIALMERYRPDVVVTYDENGGYGHPDHIQAHRIALYATETSGIPAKFYYTAVPRRRSAEFFNRLRAEVPGFDFELPEDFGTPDEEITTFVDVSPYVEQKRKALEAHVSQADSIFFLRLPVELQREMFAGEAFIRRLSRVDAPDHEDDLFAGLPANA
jgi:LmbE family N-acetylglucosaminyl deacetylase